MFRESDRNCYPKTSLDSIEQLLKWLTDNINDENYRNLLKDNIYFDDIENKGLGCFAAKDFKSGDILFAIPKTCILSFSEVMSSETISQILSLSKNLDEELQKEITCEFLIWIFMIEQRFNNEEDNHKKFYLYMNSFDTVIITPECWGTEYLDILSNTNLGKSCSDVTLMLYRKTSTVEKLRELYARKQLIDLKSNKRPRSDDKLLPDYIFNHRSLAWARSHYISRRYPYLFPETSQESYGLVLREENFGNIGSLCPVLDILNHDDRQDYLDLTIDSSGNYFIISTKINIVKGQEIYSNYGKLSNESLLFTYGFSIDNNSHDIMSIQLKSKNSDLTQLIGTFDLKKGGLKEIPKDLWKTLHSLLLPDGDDDSISKSNIEASEPIEIDIEECEILHGYLTKKNDVLSKCLSKIRTVVTNKELSYLNNLKIKYINNYITGQLNIVKEILDDIEEMVFNE